MGAQKQQIKAAALTLALLIFGSNASALPTYQNFDQPTSSKKKQKCETDPHSLKGMIENVNIFGSDTRVVQERDGAGKAFAPIGGLESNAEVPLVDAVTKAKSSSQVRATGFLISPCYVAANYHAVFGDSTSPNKTDFSNTFYTFQGAGKAYAKTSAHPEAWGDYGTTKNPDDDWVRLKLDSCVGEKIGWLEFGSISSHNPKEKFAAAGYPGDKKATSLWVDPSCTIYKPAATTKGTWENDCALRAGSSGSPIMRVGDDGIPRVVAMQASERQKTDGVLSKYDTAHTNYAVDVATAYNYSMDLITADRQRVGSNPAISSGALAARNL